MWNMHIIHGLYLSSQLRLYFKDHGGPLCKELTFPPLTRIFSALFPCILPTFTKTEYMVLPFSSLSGLNPHILALCLGGKTPTLKGKLNVSFL